MSICQKCGETDEAKLTLCYKYFSKKANELRSYYYCRDCNKDRRNKYNSVNRDVLNKNVTKSNLKYPEKKYAREQVKSALKTGRLVKQPCGICGEQISQAHHTDYSKPLEVQWLCSGCHAELHKKINLQIK